MPCHHTITAFDTGGPRPYDYWPFVGGKDPAMADCDNIRKNLQGCTCTYTSCDKRGACCACVAYHRSSGELPGCFFPPEAERTYDRSVECFVKVMKGRM
jgi:hypothetical protein